MKYHVELHVLRPSGSLTQTLFYKYIKIKKTIHILIIRIAAVFTFQVQTRLHIPLIPLVYITIY